MQLVPVWIHYHMTWPRRDKISYFVTPYIPNATYLTFHKFMDLVRWNPSLYGPLRTNVIFYVILRYYVSYQCFESVFTNPHISGAFYMYTLYMSKVWWNLNTPLDTSHPYRTRIISWNVPCHKWNIYIVSHKHLQ